MFIGISSWHSAPLLSAYDHDDRGWEVPTNLAGALAESLSTRSNHPAGPEDVSENGKGSIDTKASSRLLAVDQISVPCPFQQDISPSIGASLPPHRIQ